LKRERWEIIASVCVCVLVIGAVLVLAGFTGGGHFSPDALKRYIAQSYSDQQPAPGTAADQRYEAGNPDPGYDREAVLDAKIALFEQMYGIGSMGSTIAEINYNISKQEIAINNNNDVIATVDGTPVKKSALEAQKLYQKANFLGGIVQFNSADFAPYKDDASTRLQFKEEWTATQSEADMVFNAIQNTMAMNEAEKLGVAMSMDDAKTAVQQNLQSIIDSATGATAENAATIDAYIQGLGLTTDEFITYYAAQYRENSSIQSLVDHFKGELAQDVQQDQNKLSEAWNAYVDALVQKASIRLE
jgi:hypothetical protein